MKKIVFSLLILAPVAVNATEIRPLPYKYSYDVARDAVNEAEFVICDVCPRYVHLVQNPPEVVLALKIAEEKEKFEEEEDPIPGQFEETPEVGNGRLINPAVFQSKDPAAPKENKPSLLATVYFELNQSKLSGVAKAELDKAIAALDPKVKISVTGYTCDIGSKAYNDRLAAKRATSVADYLKSNHISLLELEGKGKCCYVSEQKEKNRRVELILK